MKSFAFAAIAACAVATIDVEELSFIDYLSKWNKVYHDIDEFRVRLEHFVRNGHIINEHNATESSYKLGHNQFSDWSPEEYSRILGYKRGTRLLKADGGDCENPTLATNGLPTEVNWVDAGAVTGVKDQGACGSCWAFSTTGSLEGAHFVATGELLSFSEQQLVSCNKTSINQGCNGGFQDEAYKYYEDGAKAELESVYPYPSGNYGYDGKCLYDEASTTAVTVSNYTCVTPSQVDQMKAAVANQPTAVAIQANMPCFQFYHSGVMDNQNCGTNLDHAVLAVGYGTDAATGKDYWLVKNSWNTSWGDKGYIKLAMDDSDGACGVQMDPNQPTTN